MVPVTSSVNCDRLQPKGNLWEMKFSQCESGSAGSKCESHGKMSKFSHVSYHHHSSEGTKVDPSMQTDVERWMKKKELYYSETPCMMRQAVANTVNDIKQQKCNRRESGLVETTTW